MEETINFNYFPGGVAFKFDKDCLTGKLPPIFFALVGIAFIGLKGISFIRLILSLFVLPGKSVIYIHISMPKSVC